MVIGAIDVCSAPVKMEIERSKEEPTELHNLFLNFVLKLVVHEITSIQPHFSSKVVIIGAVDVCSAPVKMEIERTEEELAFLLANDSDPFNKWEAGQVTAY